MGKLLYQWDLNPTTWVYLSSLITLAVYFKFNRWFSVRNLDLLALIATAPGLLMTQHPSTQQLGYAWLFVAAAFFLVRLLIDPMMIRRPLLEPNLTVGGLTFMGASLLVFLMTNVVTSSVQDADLDGPKRADLVLQRQAAKPQDKALATHGPGYPLLHVIASVPGKALIPADTGEADEADRNQLRNSMVYKASARTMAILAHLAVVVGIVLVGYWHFDNLTTGLAAAALYLLLPYTAEMVSRVEHVLPAALIVWALVFYRRPVISGVFLALAAGAMYYPIFLLPLWVGFYWHRGLGRFALGFSITLGLVVASLALTSSSVDAFLAQARQMFGWAQTSAVISDGFWSADNSVFRIPVICAFMALCLGMAVWPVQKNLGTLLSCSAAVMLGTQFWHPHQGGLYMAWYLPPLLLTVFRPNLEDRVAVAVLGKGWFPMRRIALRRVA